MERIITVTGEIERHSAHAVVVLQEDTETCFLSTNAMGSYGSLENTQERSFFANPCYTQFTNMYSCFRRSNQITLMSGHCVMTVASGFLLN
jgi:hypothetical protein